MAARPLVTVRIVPVALEEAPSLAASAVAALLSVLDDDERARADALRFDPDRARFALSHAAVRCCLAERLGTAPARVRFRYGPFGKPAVEPDLGTPAPFFSLSHSRTLALVALADAEVGVDVEDVSPHVDELAL